MMPILDWSAFAGQLLTVCKCGFDTMAPVERTKWMTDQPGIVPSATAVPTGPHD